METTKAKTEDLRYPIGEFDANIEITPQLRREMIQSVKDLPSKIKATVEGLSDQQLDTRYRPEGWTVRQTVHHVADSHINSLCRFKLALTEENPLIRQYYEELWSELADSKLPIDVSLKMIDAIHDRWSALLASMSDADFARAFIHPETGTWPLDGALALYAWHSLHHTAHITSLRERESW